MALTIICVTGPGSTGKSTIIREFTAKYLKYTRSKGDVLGVFRMPRYSYAVGVSGSGDDLSFIIEGRKFLIRYKGLHVMLTASRSEGRTLHEVKRFAKKKRSRLHLIVTKKIATASQRRIAIDAAVAEIRGYMPNLSRPLPKIPDHF